jgi:hypothetical protein
MGWARSTVGQPHSSPCDSRPRLRKNGDASAIGTTAAQSSCSSPGIVFSLVRMPPPIVSAASRTVTPTPCWARVTAAASPLGPDPTTIAVVMDRASLSRTKRVRHSVLRWPCGHGGHPCGTSVQTRPTPTASSSTEPNGRHTTQSNRTCPISARFGQSKGDRHRFIRPTSPVLDISRSARPTVQTPCQRTAPRDTFTQAREGVPVLAAVKADRRSSRTAGGRRQRSKKRNLSPTQERALVEHAPLPANHYELHWATIMFVYSTCPVCRPFSREIGHSHLIRAR